MSECVKVCVPYPFWHKQPFPIKFPIGTPNWWCVKAQWLSLLLDIPPQQRPVKRVPAMGWQLYRTRIRKSGGRYWQCGCGNAQCSRSRGALGVPHVRQQCARVCLGPRAVEELSAGALNVQAAASGSGLKGPRWLLKQLVALFGQDDDHNGTAQ